jgi:hypothetical protein
MTPQQAAGCSRIHSSALEPGLVLADEVNQLSIQTVKSKQPGIGYAARKTGVFLFDGFLYPVVAGRDQALFKHVFK